MNDFNLAHILRVVRKHLFKCCAFALLVLTAGWLAMVIWPRTYGSEAKLFIKVGRESVALDPTATTGQTLMLQKTQEDEVNSALEILGSRGIREKLVDELSPEVILTGKIPDQNESKSKRRSLPAPIATLIDGTKGAIDRIIDYSQVRDPISDRERAVNEIEDMVSVNANRNSTMISIYTEASSAKLAQLISDKMSALYLQEHLRIRETPGSKKFFEDTSRELENELTEKANEIRNYKQANLILSIDDNRLALRANVEATQLALQNTQRDVEFTTANIAELSQRIELLPVEVIASTEASTWSGMRQRLFELQVEEKRLLSTASETHPAVIKVSNQRKDLEQLLAKFEAESADQTKIQNPIRQQLEQELISMKATLAGQKARMKGLILQKTTLEKQLNELASHEVQLNRLERELAMLDTSFRQRLEKLEEANISAQLDARKISNVTVAQPASLMEKPVGPQKVTMLAGTLLLAMMGALGIPAFIETFSVSRISDDPNVGTTLRLPVTARVPRVESLRLGRQKRETVAEECGRILQKIRSSSTGDRLGSIGLLSCDNKTTTGGLASQLAIIAGTKYGLSTLLIDADKKMRSVSKMFRLNGAPGFGELATTSADVDECVQTSKYENLMLMTPQSKTRTLPRLAHPQDVEAVLERFKEQYDLVIVDLPYDESYEGAISRQVDKIFVVADSERTSTETAAETVNRLRDTPVTLTGLVLQGANQHHGR